MVRDRAAAWRSRSMATSADGVDPATHDCDFPSQDAAAGAQSQCMAPRPERSAVEDEDQPASCRRPLTSRRDAAQEPRQRLEPLLPLEQLRIVHPRQASHQRKACQLDPRQRNPRPRRGQPARPSPGFGERADRRDPPPRERASTPHRACAVAPSSRAAKRTGHTSKAGSAPAPSRDLLLARRAGPHRVRPTEAIKEQPQGTLGTVR